MHRKKFLSFLGMAAVAAPIIVKEIPQTSEVKPLELKEGFLGIGTHGPSQQLDTITVTDSIRGVTVGGPYPSEGQILVLHGDSWQWQDPFEGFNNYTAQNFAVTPYEPSVGTITLLSNVSESHSNAKAKVWNGSDWVEPK